MSVDYTSFPVVCTSEFEAVTFDCTLSDNGYYYLMLSFFKNFADDDINKKAQGFILATDIKARTLEEIDAQCGVLYDVGLFNHLHIDSHGSLFDDSGNTIGPICWNHIAESKITVDDIREEPAETITIQ